MRKPKKYLITLAAGFVVTALVAWSKGVLNQTTAVGVYHILCDAFCVSGVVIAAAGGLIFTANEGTFDMLSYGIQSFMDMFRKEKKLKYDTFYDYKMDRAEKKAPFGFLLICGLFFLAVSMVMLYLYHLNGG